MAQSCKNHTSSQAHRKCYQCHEYICPKCQIKSFHHIFCSWYCILRFAITDKLNLKSIKREYLYLFLVLFFIQILMHFVLHSDPDLDSTPQLEHPVTAKQNPLDTLFSAYVDNLDIRGKVKANSIIGIKRDGVFIASEMAEGDTYLIKDLPLVHGANDLSVWALLADGRSFLIDSLKINYVSTNIRNLARPVYQVETEEKILALTFDAGSAANGADSIINILNDKQVKCTIFLTGDFIRRYPDLVSDLRESGHELANHSYSHPHLTSWAQNNKHLLLANIDREFIQNELLKTDSIYVTLTGESLANFWRAPFGEFNDKILEWAAEKGYRHIGWSRNCDSFDWVTDNASDIYRTPDELYSYFMDLEGQNRLQGAIILMHLNSNRDKDHAYQILPKLIDSFREKNYKLTTVSDMLYRQKSY